MVGDPINGIDPSGLWGTQIGDFKIGSGYATFVFDASSWGVFEDALAATADGVIPFFDPFSDTYDPCNRALRWSKRLGAFSRDVALAAWIPNLGAWAKNPVLYEVGQKTLPAARWAGLKGLDPVARGAELVRQDGWLRALMPTLSPAIYGSTIGTGLTPGGWLAVLGVGQAIDTATWDP